MSGRTLHEAIVHVDSDLRVSGTPTDFQVSLDRPLNHVRKVKVLNVQIPNTIKPFTNLAVRFSIDEELFEHKTLHPRGFFDGSADNIRRSSGNVTAGFGIVGTVTPIIAYLTGNFNQDSHFADLAKSLLLALNTKSATVASLRTNVIFPIAPLLQAHYFLGSVSANSTTYNAGGELTQPIEQRYLLRTLQAGGVVYATANAFTPKFAVGIDRNGKTVIYSNCVIRLRPIDYGTVAAGTLEAATAAEGIKTQTAAQSLMANMGFDIKVNDPGVHEFTPIDRKGTGTTTFFSYQGDVVDGFVYPYKLTSEFPAEFATKRYVYIASPTFALHTQETAISHPSHQILCKVPLGDYGTIPNLDQDHFTTHPVNMQALTTIAVRILGPDGLEPDVQDISTINFSLKLWYFGR